MPDIKHCDETSVHGKHSWTEKGTLPDYPEEVTLHHVCNGTPSKSTLQGATREPAAWAEAADAGEFAARWNAMDAEERERAFQHLLKSQQTAVQCFIRNHETLEEELRDKRQADWRAEGQIENLLADELYDGSNGPLNEERMEDYRRSLARKLNADFGPPAPVVPVRDTQWYAYWTGVHQSVQHWADGSQMKCPYPQPPIDSEYHCAKDPGCNIKYGGEAPDQEHSARCAQLNRVAWGVKK